MVALVRGEPQRAGERGEHLLGRLRAALLLEPGCSSRWTCAASSATSSRRRPLVRRRAPAAQADVVGLQRLAAPAQEVGQLRTVHHRPSIGVLGSLIQGS